MSGDLSGQATTGPTDADTFLDTTATEAARLLAAAETSWSSPVRHCPGWDAADLVRHTGHILYWVGAIVRSGERISRRTLDPAPTQPSDLVGWFRDNVTTTVDILRAADSQAQTWTFSTLGDHSVNWWRRRLAVEVGIHRWDAEYAGSVQDDRLPSPLDADVAGAGIAEFMTEFLPGLLSNGPGEPMRGTLHLHATDGPVEWWTDLGNRVILPEHRRADTALRASRSDLLLWLTNRRPSHPLDVQGRYDILTSWSELRR